MGHQRCSVIAAVFVTGKPGSNLTVGHSFFHLFARLAHDDSNTPQQIITLAVRVAYLIFVINLYNIISEK